jgi:PAS domain S-box-containing protein
MQEIHKLNRALEERNQRLQQLADDLAASILSERRAYEALRDSEQRFRRAIIEAPFPIVLHAEGGEVLQLSKAWTELSGYTPGELPTLAVWTERAYGQGKDAVREQIEQLYKLDGRVHEGEYVITTRTGAKRTWDFSSAPLGHLSDGRRLVISMAMDVTERHEAEEQLRLQNTRLQEMARSERQAHEALKAAQTQLVHTERLAALGTLVAGVAHEINNPLSFVNNNVAVLQRDVSALSALLDLYRQADGLLAEHRPDLAARLRDLAEQMDLRYTLSNLEGLMARSRDGLKRIQQIVKDLREFARIDESDLHEVDVNAGVESTVNIIRGQAKQRQVAVELNLAPLPEVTCFPAKINQVVLNLVVNAIDACPPEGKVAVSTRPTADGVELVVADTGHGIDPAIRDKIFDPFFTTKPQGKGTGLGLSISYGIVQAHGGQIDVDSVLGQGTRFVVRLPLKPPRAVPVRAEHEPSLPHYGV